MVSENVLFALAALAVPAAALSGKATTTRYWDGQEGACGCGSSSGMFGWQTGIGSGIYTAAASQAIYDSAGSSWCGAGCGQCFQLTSTGSAPSGQGTGGTAGQTITVMVTNLCPNNGNAQWCPNPGQTNAFGYEYHFDIMASSSSVSPIIGDNPIVSFQSVSCPGQASSDFSQCVCANGSSGSSGSSGSGSTGSGSTGSGSTGSGSTGSGSSGSSSGTVAQWGQCGGTGYTGSTTCASGFTCKEQNQYYSQCL